jgi:hypothetical protein
MRMENFVNRKRFGQTYFLTRCCCAKGDLLMPTTIGFPLSANRSQRLDGWRRDRSGASADLAMLTLWAIIMLWIAAAGLAASPAADASVPSLMGVL